MDRNSNTGLIITVIAIIVLVLIGYALWRSAQTPDVDGTAPLIPTTTPIVPGTTTPTGTTTRGTTSPTTTPTTSPTTTRMIR